MGAFGIYALVVTFIFVIYYVVMICMDLFGTKGEKKENIEVIHTGASVVNTEAVPVIIPNKIRETGDGKYQIERDGQVPEIFGGQEATPFSDEKEEEKAMNEDAQNSPTKSKPLSVDDIAHSDNELLAKESAQAKAYSLKDQFTPISPEIHGAVSLADFNENYVEALLKGKQEAEQAELLNE